MGDIREAVVSYMWFCNAGQALAQYVDIIVRHWLFWKDMANVDGLMNVTYQWGS